MTAVGILSIILGLALSLAFAMVSRSPVCVILFLYHTAASILYWLYSLNQPADATFYYAIGFDSSVQLRPGTPIVTWITSTIRDSFGASYLDMFMIFHIAGYIGVALLYLLCKRAVEDKPGADKLGNNANSEATPTYLPIVIAFLPGLHVWTSAIGKDSLVFLGVACVLWGASHRGIGMLYMLVGLAICSVIRPHIAFLLGSSAAVALLLSGGVPMAWRLMLVPLLVSALWYGLPSLQSFLRLEDMSSSGMIEYVETRQSSNLQGATSLNISDYSLPFQFFTFMYRPLFLDAGGALGTVVSVENLVYLGLTAMYLPRAIALVFKGGDSFFLRFNFLYWLIGSTILASTTPNLGLAIRQKTMVAPSLILITLAAYAKRRRDLAAATENEGALPERQAA